MIRTQIQIPESQYRQLKRWANQLGISVSEAVRRCIEQRFAAEKVAPDRASRVRDALAVLGKYRDEQPSTVGPDHDDHLSKAFDE